MSRHGQEPKYVPSHLESNLEDLVLGLLPPYHLPRPWKEIQDCELLCTTACKHQLLSSDRCTDTTGCLTSSLEPPFWGGGGGNRGCFQAVRVLWEPSAVFCFCGLLGHYHRLHNPRLLLHIVPPYCEEQDCRLVPPPVGRVLRKLHGPPFRYHGV